MGACACDCQTQLLPTPHTGELYWRVSDCCSSVLVEFRCHDAGEAIKLSEWIVTGLSQGRLELEVRPPD